MNKRYKEIDLARGIGIILVVFGHALKQTGTLTESMEILLSLIYSFHMPLFFVLSGFVALKVVGLAGMQERVRYIGGRAQRLLIPYLVMSIVYIPLKMYMSSYAIKKYNISDAWRILIGDSPNTAVWFLYILFLCSAFAALILNMKNLNVILIAALVLSAVACAMEWPYKFPKYFFFFVLGIALRAHYSRWKEMLYNGMVSALSFVLFVVGNIFYYRFGGAWYLLTALTGTILILNLAICISAAQEKSTHVPAWVNALYTAGEYSMDIYIFSEPIITVLRLILWNILHVNFVVCTAVCFLGGMIIPIPVSRLIVRRIGFLRLLFLGIGSDKKA